MSLKLMGRSTSYETKLKLSQSMMGKQNSLGVILSPETRLNMSISQTGRSHSDETREKMSLAHQGNLYGLGNINALGYKHTEDSIVKSVSSKNKALKLKGVGPSRCEKVVLDIINRDNIPLIYNGYGPLMVGVKVPDFVSSDESYKLLEVFEDYWHSDIFDDIRPNELELITYYSCRGYDCLVLWGSDIDSTSDRILSCYIKDFLKR